MKVWAIGLGVVVLAIVAGILVFSSQQETYEQQTTGAPVVYTMDKPCKAQLGEGCSDCGCLAPAKCVNEICILTNQEDGSVCAYDQQCKSRHCIDNTCGYENKLVTTCKYECRDDYYGRRNCSTVCNE